MKWLLVLVLVAMVVTAMTDAECRVSDNTFKKNCKLNSDGDCKCDPTVLNIILLVIFGIILLLCLIASVCCICCSPCLMPCVVGAGLLFTLFLGFGDIWGGF